MRNVVKQIGDLYRKHGISEPADLKIKELAELFNVHVAYYPKGTCVFKFLDGDNMGVIISLDERLTEQEQYEEFCHELAHILLEHKSHKSYLKFLTAEMEADTLGMYLAIPTFMLSDIDLYADAISEVSEIFNVTRDFAQERLELLCKDMTNRKFFIDDKSSSSYVSHMRKMVAHHSFGG